MFFFNKYKFRFNILLFSIFLFTTCSKDQQLDSIDIEYAEDLWLEVNKYDNWQQHNEWLGIKPSIDGTHGDYVQIWFNDIAFSDIEHSAEYLSGNAIIIKEGYSDSI